MACRQANSETFSSKVPDGSNSIRLQNGGQITANLGQLYPGGDTYLVCFENLPEHTLGQRIKKARLYLGYNKREFAKKIGVSARMIWLWEKDEYRPSEKYMERLDKFLAIFPSL
ncbi:helix-turn-helix domain-containing protein [Brevibacillus thermoruber]|uniref:Helix-turn-helix transcriptional regulator n=1 Tax=Brevibacillus thermoruber TaxID=33942 RepID=A0A9X3TTH8_9BACL|nr:helix-turn-helix transcriptional regulator [Brevibacillus thermoruber]MDA5110811.1 helix-turn-helix transcriptional regulator [Brevibacillus thermoruber]